MKRRILIAFVIPLLALAFYNTTLKKEDSTINLRFTKNYPAETVAKQKTGLLWALSYLGAALPQSSLKKLLIKKDSVLFELHLDKAGFDPRALHAFETLLVSLKESEEYKVMKGIDLGEFIVYTLGSSWHYYEITGAAKTLNDYKSRYNYNNTVLFPVLSSDVAFHHRMLEMVKTDTVKKMSFIAVEGKGSIEDRSFTQETYEVFDIMPNGQLRFAIYDKEGNLSGASEREFGNAGKPVKCLWCHEINIQPLFRRNKSLEGFTAPEQFNSFVSEKMAALRTYRSTLQSGVNFNNLQDHALMEILYISFMEPSLYKLTNEWGVGSEDKFSGFEKHDHHEHAFLKNLFERGRVKSLSPYKTVMLPDSIWEANPNEPNVFH